MKITEIREKAKKLKINSGKVKKTDLIRMIQKAEGNTVCFGHAKNHDCPHIDCCFREDCLD